MKDFSLDIYRAFLEKLHENGYDLISYADSIAKSQELRAKRYVILRHDVDAKPGNSLKTAQIEHAIGAKATYYFRCGKESNQPEIIRAIAQLGHEIGYHYEDMSLCEGDAEKAWDHFQTWLAYFRQYYAVETICMHGSPTSRWDNKTLWKTHDYRSLGIIGEPYLDTDWSDVFYLTDTGRCWDGYRVSVRDKIPQHQDEWTQQGLTWHTTQELIRAVESGQMPKHVMITTHPQRWTNDSKQWWIELVTQTTKNVIKKLWIRNNRSYG